MLRFKFFIFNLVFILCLTNCNDIKSPRNFEFYKIKYNKAVRHYSSPKDSLKLKALYFILENLSDQYHYQGEWVDAYNKLVIGEKNISINDLVNKLDSIKRIYPTLLYKVKDEALITNSQLIENIDKAFITRKFKWVENLPFDDFCEYVLPYKIGNEKPELRETWLNDEAYLKNDSLLNIKDMFKATAYINNRLSWFHGSVNYDFPIDLGYKMSRLIATGTCYSQARMALFQMHAIGLPTTIDFAPSWGNRSSGHYWNALIYRHCPYPLDPTGANIGFYKIGFKGVNRIPYKVSKVFRQTFSIQNESLRAIADTLEPMPQIFNNRRIKDVTSDYVPTSTVVLEYSSGFLRKFAYLFTFDDHNWIPSYWGIINRNQIFFKNMGRDIVYLPGIYYSLSNIASIGNPFILTTDGQTKELKRNLQITQTLVLTKKYPEDETNNIFKGNKYELFYWDVGWKSLGIQIAKSSRLYFYKVPTNALFWLRNLTKGKQERIFTYENNSQIWW